MASPAASRTASAPRRSSCPIAPAHDPRQRSPCAPAVHRPARWAAHPNAAGATRVTHPRPAFGRVGRWPGRPSVRRLAPAHSPARWGSSRRKCSRLVAGSAHRRLRGRAVPPTPSGAGVARRTPGASGAARSPSRLRVATPRRSGIGGSGRRRRATSNAQYTSTALGPSFPPFETVQRKVRRDVVG